MYVSDCEPVSSVPCERDHKALKSKASCRQAFAFKLFSSVLYSDDEHLFFFLFPFRGFVKDKHNVNEQGKKSNH